MSATSAHELEASLTASPSVNGTVDDDNLSPEDEQRLDKLRRTRTGGPVLAVDLDDVLSETNHSICAWHNQKYGTKMTVDSFYCVCCSLSHKSCT